jgi:hypothetical protein
MIDMYTYEDYIPDALQLVSTWDIPEDDLADAVVDQAQLMAHCCPDEAWEDCPYLMP